MNEISKTDRRSANKDRIILKAEAQRRVTRFVVLEIGDRLSGGDPVRIRDRTGRTFWLVPVMLAIPHESSRKVGAIAVEMATGQLQVTESGLAEIIAEAERLAGELVSV